MMIQSRTITAPSLLESCPPIAVSSGTSCDKWSGRWSPLPLTPNSTCSSSSNCNSNSFTPKRMIIMNTSYQEEHQDHHSRNHYDGNESTTTTALNATGAGAVTPTLPPFSDSSANSSPSGKGVNTSPLSTTSTLKRITPERDETTDEPKRRRVMRACDICRRRKIRCDGPTSGTGGKPGPDAKCTHCRESRLACTYVNEPVRKSTRPGLVTALQERCFRLEQLVQQLRPGFKMVEIVGPAIDIDTFDEDAHREVIRGYRIPPLPELKCIAHIPMLQARTLPRRASMPAPPVWSTIGTPVTSALVVEPFVVPARAEPTQFYGRAATHNLIQTAGSGADSAFDSELDRVRRPRIWRVPEWEAAVLNEGLGLGDQSIWPEDEQAAILFDAYFANVNCIFPLLHPGLFRKHYFQRLYLSDNAFARVCLMVFANGARYTPSVRFTLWPGSTEASSAGWKYLRAAMLSMTSLRETPTLFGLQAAALLGFFLRGNVNTSTTWAIVGDALRSAQELGIHIRLPPVASVTELQQRELSARAFWCLYHLDRTMCVIVGRAVALLDSEVTASIPLAIDDACWDDESFPQPPPVGHVSELDAFVSMLALDRLVSTAIECIPAMPADGPGVAPLPRKDSLSISATLINLVASFNSWSRSLPPHLQWGEHVSSLPDQTFLRLAHLHARYHWAVIYVHYGGVAAGEWAPGLSFDTSTQSAQAIFGICETLLQHRMFAGGSSGGTTKAVRPIPFEFIDYALLAAAITLAAINSSALPAGKYESAMVGVNTCIATLMQMDGTSRKSGQVADLLTVMARNVGNVGVQTPVQNQQHQMPTPMSVHSAQMDAGSLTGTPYGRSVASVPSLPSSFSGGMPQTPPDQFPWIFSSPFGAPMHAHAHAHTHHPHAHGQQMYYADPSVPVTAPPVLSILIPGDGFMPTTQHSPPLSASAPASTSVSVANSSPVDSVPPQLPFAGHGPGPHSAATTHDIHDPQQHCGAGTGAGATPTGATADARWPHLLSAYVNIPPHPELHHLHLHDTPGAFAHHH